MSFSFKLRLYDYIDWKSRKCKGNLQTVYSWAGGENGYFPLVKKWNLCYNYLPVAENKA